MPRPYVEVHQRVLNPVVTINDPQQQVCLVGLHMDKVTDSLVHTVSATYSAGGNAHKSSWSADVEFTVDVDGVLINSDIELGPDAASVVEGDLTLTLKDPRFSLTSLSVVNATESGDTISRISGLSISSNSTITVARLQSLEDMQVVLVPAASYTHVLMQDGGVPGLDFTTGSYPGAAAPITELLELGAGSAVTLSLDGANTSFTVLKKEADKIYLGSSSKTTLAKLKANGSLCTKTGIGISGISGFTFKTVNSGAITVGIDGRTSSVTRLSVDGSNPPIVLTATSDCSAAFTHRGSSFNLSELDSSNPLEVDSQSTGDVSVTVPKERLVVSEQGTVIYAEMYMSYSVAKSTYTAAMQEVDLSTLVQLLGVPSPTNQLALAAEMALLNAPSSKVNVLALDLLPRDEDEKMKPVAAAFLDALAVLERSRTVYAMVPLTTDLQVTSAYAKSAEAMSLPKRGKFRICLGSSTGAPKSDYIVGTEVSLATSGLVSDVADSVSTLSDVAVNFKSASSLVLVGDSVYAVQGSSVYTGTVKESLPGGLKVTWDTSAGLSAGALSYRIFRSITSPSKKARQIEIMKSVASSVASKRLFLTFPGTCTVESANAGQSFSGMPSYFLTAAFSGLMASMDIHRPKNFAGVAGVSLDDIARFSDDELDSISDNGFLVFQQTTSGSLPFCVHQVNTYHGVQAGTQEFTELSVLANYDFVSSYLKAIVDPYAGTVNIVPEALGSIKASLQAGLTNLMARKVVGIGAPVTVGSVDFVRQASYDAGTVEASVVVKLPKVLNKLVLEVVSA